MAKSFLEYVENRVFENFDYNEAAMQINAVVSEQGHITPQQLHELLTPRFISKAAEKLGGAIGAGTAVARKLAGDAASKVGSSFYNVGMDTAGAIGRGIGRVADYGADKLARAQQYGADVAQAGAMGAEYGAGRERMRQKQAVLGHEKAGAERLQSMGGIGSQEAGQRAAAIEQEMSKISHIMNKLSREEQAQLYKAMRELKGAA